jgi:hypothetical protein
LTGISSCDMNIIPGIGNISVGYEPTSSIGTFLPVAVIFSH